MRRGMYAVAIGIGLQCGATFGAGFQLYTEGSAEALGQAAAISGRDDLASLAWYNPAALAGADRTMLQAGSVLVQLQTDFTSASNTAWNSSMSDDWRFIPHFNYVKPITPELTAMLSVNAPYGLITEWPADWAGNLAATYSEFTAVYSTPSLAYRVSDRLAVAAGVNVVYASANLKSSRDLSSVNPMLPDYGIRTVTGDDIGYGYAASMHCRLSDAWSAGGRYQSSVRVKLEGDVEFENYPASRGNASIELPSSINLGVVLRPTDRLRLGCDVVWTEWSTYDQLIYNFSAGYPSTVVAPGVDLTPNPEVNSKRWDDVWSIRAGGEYALTDAWIVRAGYVWDQSPVNNATRTPELPGADRQMIMAGLGWGGKSLNIDLAYAYLWAADSPTGLEVAARIPALDGRYGTITHVVGLSVGYTY